MNKYKDLTIGFLRAGVLGFGGGVACLPLIQREVVDKYGWLTSSEFSEVVAISNTLPGPINTKMAGYIGYRLAGVMGAIIAVLATTLPSVIVLILLLEVLASFREHPIVAGMTNAIIPVVGLMLGLMAWQLLSSAAKDMKWLVVVTNVVLAYILIELLSLHPALVVGAMILLALYKPNRYTNKEDQ